MKGNEGKKPNSIQFNSLFVPKLEQFKNYDNNTNNKQHKMPH